MTGNADGWQEDKRRLHHGPPIFLVVWLLVFAPLFIWSDDALAANSTVRVVALEGALGPAKADFIIRQLHQAEDEGIAALILRIDTPGGLDASMRELTKAILGAEIPVVSFVAPNGARAASAGTYIVMASHIAAMAPATNIGSSTPVQIGGAPDMPRPRPDLPGSSDEPDGNESQDQAPDAMTRKTVNDAAAYIQSIAETRGRNVEWAALTVRESVNVRATEAVRLNVVDLIADDLPDLLRQIDGRQVTTAKGKVTLDVAQAIVEYAETDWRHDLLEIISDPSIAYGLLMIGIWGLVLEFYSPGMILPSVVGIVCLVLGAYGLRDDRGDRVGALALDRFLDRRGAGQRAGRERLPELAAEAVGGRDLHVERIRLGEDVVGGQPRRAPGGARDAVVGVRPGQDLAPARLAARRVVGARDPEVRLVRVRAAGGEEEVV